MKPSILLNDNETILLEAQPSSSFLYLLVSSLIASVIFCFPFIILFIFIGFFGLYKRIIPFDRVVDINVRQNPIEKCFGLHSVVIDAPGAMVGSGVSRGTIIMWSLTTENAEKISEFIGQAIRDLRHKTK